MEQVWVRFASEHPIRQDESMAAYLERFLSWCTDSVPALKRLVQLERAVQTSYTLLMQRQLLVKDGRPTEYATREEREMLHSIGRAARGEEM